MTSAPSSVVVLGFGPFQEIRDNPAAHLASAHLRGKRQQDRLEAADFDAVGLEEKLCMVAPPAEVQS